MNILKAVARPFVVTAKKVKAAVLGTQHLVQRGVNAAIASGLTDQIMKVAITAVKKAADTVATNAEKREMVVKALVAEGCPEFIARAAVELAVAIWKSERAK